MDGVDRNPSHRISEPRLNHDADEGFQNGQPQLCDLGLSLSRPWRGGTAVCPRCSSAISWTRQRIRHAGSFMLTRLSMGAFSG
eukprot:CAMPEP_0185280742 /NCGR_PEP_ID=MMETSP1359-20130426/66323_1 /TAXON_ID=552665 /ORGANISM="Bigelowiella longifila, Strain CCMP242" /LENGTH=82 /DNA_ID=CAMNT_0027876079 /DNA_START=715 /DNA_END=960 /DNA_ORIENTATION=+